MIDSPVGYAKDRLSNSPTEVVQLHKKYLDELKVIPESQLLYLPIAVSATFGYPSLFKEYNKMRYVKQNRPTK